MAPTRRQCLREGVAFDHLLPEVVPSVSYPSIPSKWIKSSSETVWELRQASEPPEHEAEHRERDPGLGGGTQALIVWAEATITEQPGECALDHPPARKDLEPGLWQ